MVEKLTMIQKYHLEFLEQVVAANGSFAPGQSSRAISTETAAELVALGALEEKRPKQRKVYTITFTGEQYLAELQQELINDPAHLRADFAATLRSYRGGSSTGAFMLSAHASTYSELEVDETYLLQDAFENISSAYSQQQARLLLLGELIKDNIDESEHKLINFSYDSIEPSHKLIGLKPTNFDAQMIRIIRDYFQQRYSQKTESEKVLEVSNSFVISAALFALASLIEVSQGSLEKETDNE